MDPKGIFQVFKTKTREELGPLKTDNGELVSCGKGTSKILNEYFLTVFTQDNIRDKIHLTRQEYKTHRIVSRSSEQRK